MRALLCVTKEKEWISHLGSLFPELELKVHVAPELPQSIVDEGKPKWSAILIDLDALTGSPESILAEAKGVAEFNLPVIATVPVRLLGLVSDLRRAGMYILHKPASAGEVGLALGRIIKQG